MKVRSTIEKVIKEDRISQQKGFIEIEIIQTEKDDINKIYIFETSDKGISIDEKGVETYFPIIQMENNSQFKRYIKTYAEYDYEKEQLSQMFPTDLTGSEADDYWLQMGLLYNLSIDPIYGLTGEQWVPV